MAELFGNPLLVGFLAALTFFHLSEAVLVALIAPAALSRDSLLLSRAYCVAMLLAIAEFMIEIWLVPAIKASVVFPAIGLALIVAGECLRKAAIITAGRNFTHRIAETKSADHRLVTRGVYGWCRHPAYLGWFLWCVGTQFLLANPVCTIAFAVIAWRFFAERIPYEELRLRTFFQHEYLTYQTRVRTGLPLIGKSPRSFE